MQSPHSGRFWVPFCVRGLFVQVLDTLVFPPTQSKIMHIRLIGGVWTGASKTTQTWWGASRQWAEDGWMSTMLMERWGSAAHTFTTHEIQVESCVRSQSLTAWLVSNAICRLRLQTAYVELWWLKLCNPRCSVPQQLTGNLVIDQQTLI